MIVYTYMLKNIISLTKKFIAVESVDGNSKGLHEVLDMALAELSGFTIERFESHGVPSALVYVADKRPKKFAILLNVHLDVVPGKKANYKAKVVGDKLYGVGSMDMKGNAAAAIYAFKEVARMVNYPIALQLVTDEEVGGVHATKYQVSKGVRADFVLATEPTNFEIVHKAKGVLQVKISNKGITAHGAYPWRGQNAILAMSSFLAILQKKNFMPKKEKWATTVNVSRIETTNNAFNKIPDDCTVFLDIRYIAEDAATILEKIKGLLPEGFNLEITSFESSVFTNPKDPTLVLLKKVTESIVGSNVAIRGAHGTSDVSHFGKVNCPGVEFGPIGGGIGSDDEWVDMPSLETYYRILKEFILEQGKR